MITTVAKPRVHVFSDFRLHHTCSIIIIIMALLTKWLLEAYIANHTHLVQP